MVLIAIKEETENNKGPPIKKNARENKGCNETTRVVMLLTTPSNWHLLLSAYVVSTHKWKNVTYKHKTNGGKKPSSYKIKSSEASQ